MKAVRLNATTYPVEPGERDELGRVGLDLIEIEGQRPEERQRQAGGRRPVNPQESDRDARRIDEHGGEHDRILASNALLR